MKTDFSKLPVGTRVWDAAYGFGKITKQGCSIEYPVGVEFEKHFCFETYTYDGRYSGRVNQTLFLNEFEIPAEAYQPPLPDLKVDDKLIVWQDPTRKYKQYFSHFRDAKMYCFSGGTTSWSSDGSITQWDHWEIPTNE